MILVLTYYTVYISIYANITGKGLHRKKFTVFYVNLFSSVPLPLQVGHTSPSSDTEGRKSKRRQR
jgi:hypothetical protein